MSKMYNMAEIGFPNYSISKDGEVFSLITKRFLSGTINFYGYSVHTLKDSLGKPRKMKTHRLLALMFIDGDKTLCVNHKDGNKLNNNLDNLEWCTLGDNNRHALETGLVSKHKDFNVVVPSDEIVHNYECKGRGYLTDDDVHYACQLAEEGYRTCDISGITGFDFYILSNIFNYKHPTKNHIVKSYDLSKVKKSSRLSPSKVIKICHLLDGGLSYNEIAKIVGTNSQTISNIRNKVSYKHLTSDYNFKDI